MATKPPTSMRIYGCVQIDLMNSSRMGIETEKERNEAAQANVIEPGIFCPNPIMLKSSANSTVIL